MKRFIGLFDSGIGGLTVLKQIIDSLPEENTVYFGDMGRFPYGSRSPSVVNRYARQIVRYLAENYELKLIIAACNTVSAICFDRFNETFPIPTMGIIDSVPIKALETTKNGRIGIIGTSSVIQSGVYQRKIENLDRSVKVYSQVCPLLIYLIEEGWVNEPATKMIIGEYFANLRHSDIDTLILACTHYPILSDAIQEYFGNKVKIIDPAVECIKDIKEFLSEDNKLNKDNYPERIYLVTDNPGSFRSSGERYLDRKIHKVDLIDIGDLERMCD